MMGPTAGHEAGSCDISICIFIDLSSILLINLYHLFHLAARLFELAAAYDGHPPPVQYPSDISSKYCTTQDPSY
jgi:hypothetical protein